VARRSRLSRAARAEISAAAARMLVDGTAADFASAKRKAARELGIADTRDLPDNLELQRAVADHLVLFEGDVHVQRVRRLREAALRAMRLFAPFNPRLAGPVLYGTACAFTPVLLHLFSEEFEAVTRFLIEQRLRYDLGEARLKLGGGSAPQRVPCIDLMLYEEHFELIVLPSMGASHHPASPLNGRPTQRADEATVRGLVQSGQVFFGEHAPSP
jgi:hypothetical protein